MHLNFYFPAMKKRQAMLSLTVFFCATGFYTLIFAEDGSPFPEVNASILLPEKSHRIFRLSLERQQKSYAELVHSLILFHELKGGTELRPENQERIGLKVSTRHAPGLSTPPRLVDAVLAFLRLRGFDAEDVFLLDLDAGNLRGAGFLPPISSGKKTYRGHRVIALDSRRHFDEDWFHDSPLPPTPDFRARITLRFPQDRASRLREERRSYLPIPLFLGAHWIGLPVASDDRSIGIDAAAANGSLWAVDNNARFVGKGSVAPAATTEILAVPEYWEKHVFSILDLSRFQFASGDRFNASFVSSKPSLLLGENPFAIDAFAMASIGRVRSSVGFKPRSRKDSNLFRFAKELGLADVDKAELIDFR